MYKEKRTQKSKAPSDCIRYPESEHVWVLKADGGTAGTLNDNPTLNEQLTKKGQK